MSVILDSRSAISILLGRWCAVVVHRKTIAGIVIFLRVNRLRMCLSASHLSKPAMIRFG